MNKRALAMAVMAGLWLGAGCKPRVKEITALQRKEAASLASEAQFALSVRDVARAEATYARAAELCPDAGDYWVELGRCRMRLGRRGPAKDAYNAALAAYRSDAERNAAIRVPSVFRQIYVLVLLGRVDEAQSMLAKARKDLPDNADLRGFAESKQIDLIVANPAVKEVAL